jgi:hypothetical protein
MRRIALASLTIVVLNFGSLASAQSAADEDVHRRERLKFLDDRAAEFTLTAGRENARQLARSQAPILRWSNPVREFVNDGLTFLWLSGKRPEAVVTVWVRSPEGDLSAGELLHEFVTVSEKPLLLRRGERVLWSPEPGAAVNRPLPDAAAPQPTPARRLIQMRDLARRFHALTYKMESPHELRLLPQPLYRYQDDESDTLDGALFAFAEGNDAEALLLLEAAGDGSAWRYTLARMTSYRVVVRLDGRDVFDVNPYWKGPRSPNDPYVEAFDGPFALGE